MKHFAQFVSAHKKLIVTEVGTQLQEQCVTVEFSFMPTVMEGTTPRYTYLRQPGITSDRQGMLIIENEKILDMLRG